MNPMTSHTIRSLSLAPLVAALLVHVQSTPAAESAGDAQLQARSVLTPTAPARASAAGEFRGGRDDTRARGFDAGEQARRFILGNASADRAVERTAALGAKIAAPAAASPGNHRPGADAQEQARNVLLGRGA